MKKILSFFLVFILLLTVGCRSRKEDFSAFSRQTLADLLAEDTISQAYFLKNPEDFGIRQNTTSFGSWDPDLLRQNTTEKDKQKTVRRYLQEPSLAEDDRFTALYLDDWLTGQIVGKQYGLLQEPFGTTGGIQVELPILLSEYPMDSKEDVENYLELLSLTEEYLDSAIAFEKEKAEEGLFMSDEMLALCTEQIDRLIHESYEWLTEAFSRKIDGLALSKEEKISYLSRQISALNEDFYPAFEKAKEQLETLSGTNDKGLCFAPQGKAYYEHLLTYQVGTDKTALEAKIRIQNELISCFTHLFGVENSELSTKSTEYSLFSVDYHKIIHALKTAVLQDFPAIDNTDYVIFTVPSSMAPNVSPAFYLTPPIDDPEHNVIYMNPSKQSDYISTFQTLAHEGFPGHLYQNVYFARREPDPLRILTGPVGYSEGWATYAEIYSLRYLAKGDRALCDYLANNYSATLAIYCLCDIGIHYEGWDKEQLLNFLQVYFPDAAKEQSDELYVQILGAPANYLNYYLGYLEILDLKADYLENFPDKSEKEFHKDFLDLGPASFPKIRSALQKE